LYVFGFLFTLCESRGALKIKMAKKFCLRVSVGDMSENSGDRGDRGEKG
jgi:hypothetical protein